MSHTAPHGEVLECCLQDQQKRPIHLLRDLGQRCLDRIHDVLVETVRQVLRDPFFKRYLPLAQCMEDTLVMKMLSMQRERMVMWMISHLDTQESYIWSDNEEFRRVFQEVVKTPVPASDDLSHVRRLVVAYYDTIKTTFTDVLPKEIMKTMVLMLEKGSYQLLYDELVAGRRIDLLKDDSDTEKRRLYLEDLQGKIRLIKESMEEVESM